MKFDNGALLWAVSSLADMGHPDPEGLVARIEATKNNGNITGIAKEEAAKVGIRSVDEPVMSMFAAAQYDTRTNKTYQVSDERRSAINSRINQALFANIVPKNPFLDESGFLVLNHQPNETNVPDDEKLLGTIFKMMDEVL